MFGKDVGYGGFDGLQEMAGLLPAWSGNGGGERQQEGFQRSSVFLDGGIVLPTASGLALDVAVNGTYNVEFRSETLLSM